MLTWGRERPFLVFIKTATAHGPGPPRGPQDGCLHRGGSRAPRACPSDRRRGHGCETKHGHRAIRALKNEERMPRGTQAEPPPGASLCPPVCLHHLSGPHGQARLSGSRRALPPASDEPGSGGHSPPAPPGDAPSLGGLAVLGLGRGPHGNIHAQHSQQKESPPSRGGTDSKTGGSASAASVTGATGATAEGGRRQGRFRSLKRRDGEDSGGREGVTPLYRRVSFAPDCQTQPE